MDAINDGLNWAEGAAAGATKADQFPANTVLLRGEFKASKGCSVQGFWRTREVWYAGLSH
jgi:hypothetical protein